MCIILYTYIADYVASQLAMQLATWLYVNSVLLFLQTHSTYGDQKFQYGKQIIMVHKITCVDE